MSTSAYRRRRGALRVKRVCDLVAAGAGLIVLSPLLLGTAAVSRLLQGPPVLFKHVRPGLNGHPFTLIKFRTMRDLRHGEAMYHTDAQRVTPLGRILRATSIDELPELWNVVRGDMSLVGPRPLLMEYLDQYTPQQSHRHDMRPGVTGWAAVNGRHGTQFEERLALDVWYVDNWSLRLDLRILLMTVGQVLRRVDVSVTQDPDQVGAPLPPASSIAKTGTVPPDLAS